MRAIDDLTLLPDRFLIGVYDILPSIIKIIGFEATSAYMANHVLPVGTK